MLNPVVHFEIHCADATAQQQFYTSLFGWEINADNEWNYGLVQHRERGLGSGISPAMGVPPVARITFHVQVEDLPPSWTQKAISSVFTDSRWDIMTRPRG